MDKLTPSETAAHGQNALDPIDLMLGSSGVVMVVLVVKVVRVVVPRGRGLLGGHDQQRNGLLRHSPAR